MDLYEDILFLVEGYIDNGTLNFVTKRGLLYFELSPIYGAGAILMIYLLTRKEYKKTQYFWLGTLIGGTFEYLISFLQETFTGTVSWDYSTYFLKFFHRWRFVEERGWDWSVGIVFFSFENKQ